MHFLNDNNFEPGLHYDLNILHEKFLENDLDFNMGPIADLENANQEKPLLLGKLIRVDHLDISTFFFRVHMIGKGYLG